MKVLIVDSINHSSALRPRKEMELASLPIVTQIIYCGCSHWSLHSIYC